MSSPASTAESTARAAQTRVAVVSRLDAEAADAAAAFVTQLGMEAVVVSELDGESGTAMERLEALRQADYAVVLIGAEDLAAAAGAAAPRPELLLEIGFMLGAVGRGRLCFVVRGSGAAGAPLDRIASHRMDEGGLWRLLLAREMKQGGLDVDLNRAI